MNKTDSVYLNLIEDILKNGTKKNDRTGTGTISVFGRMIKFNMADGFPLLTTKKMFTKGIITELLWFLNGDTNIKSLVEQGNMIWVGDAYKRYINSINNSDLSYPEYGLLNKEEFIDKIKNDNIFSRKWGELGPVYGKQWVNWGGYEVVSGKEVENLNKGINQINNVLDLLSNNPNSRRIIVNAWNVSEIDNMVLPPCHYGYQLYTTKMTAKERHDYYFEGNHGKRVKLVSLIVNDNEENNEHIHKWLDVWAPFVPKYKLSLMWTQRSVDTFLGLPFNIASYGFLLHMIAQQVNMVPDELIGSLGDVHIYNNHIELVNIQLRREPREPPQLLLKKADNIYSYKLGDFEIINYNPHPTIKGELSN